jgi:hypothetical protein
MVLNEEHKQKAAIKIMDLNAPLHKVDSQFETANSPEIPICKLRVI